MIEKIRSTNNEVQKVKRNQKILWNMAFSMTFIYVGLFVGLYYLIAGKCQTFTYYWAFIVFLVAGIGIGPGSHRYFCHRSYKATRGLKLFLLFCQQLSGLTSAITWTRLHRVHHKHTDTEKDITNINRGVFYGFVGWLCMTYSEECQKALDEVYMDDLLSDKDLVFQYNNYEILYVLITALLPTLIPYFFWSETLWISFWINVMRYALNFTQQNIGNSLMHVNGNKPYDKYSSAVDNDFYNILLLGEASHNFHHTFPSDYKGSEYGRNIFKLTLGTLLIDVCAYFGWAYDLKITPPQVIARRIARTGDVSRLTPEQRAFLDVNMDAM